MIFIGAIGPRDPKFTPLLWSSRIAALAAIVFAAAAFFAWAPLPLALNLAFVSSTFALLAHLCLGLDKVTKEQDPLDLLRRIGREKNLQQRKQLLHLLKPDEKTPWGKLQKLVQEAIKNSETDIYLSCDTEVSTRCSLDSFAEMSTQQFETLLDDYFEA